ARRSHDESGAGTLAGAELVGNDAANPRAIVRRCDVVEDKLYTFSAGNGNAIALPLVAQRFLSRGTDAKAGALSWYYGSVMRLHGEVRRALGSIRRVRHANQRTGPRLEFLVLDPLQTIEAVQAAVRPHF